MNTAIFFPTFIEGINSKIKILKGIQVLVVDNDSDYGEMYEILLKHFDASVTFSRSINSALKIIDWLIPNIINRTLVVNLLLK